MVNVIFRTWPHNKLLGVHTLDLIPEGQHKVFIRDHLYTVVGHEWHITGAAFETECEYVRPPYVIVKLA